MQLKMTLPMRWLVVFFGLTVFVSCKKNDDSTGNPPPTDSPSLYETAVGKWEVTSISGRSQQPITSSKVQDDPSVTSIEFLSDSTYIVEMSDSTVTTGSFTVTDSTSITLGNFGNLTQIKITGEKINFQITYDGSTLSVSANKAAEIPDSDKTKLLCRTWLLTHELSGDSAYLDEDGVDKITILFSNTGTYLTQYLKQGVVIDAQMAHWKWHPTIPDAIVDLAGDDTSDDNYLLITELTNSSFKFSYTWEDDNTFEEFNYVLIPYIHSGRISQTSVRKAASSRNSGAHGLFGTHK